MTDTRLLVVDDSALMRKLLVEIFSGHGFEVALARSGTEALAMLGTFLPDVVTLDVHMPDMDGLACLDRIMVEHPCPVVMVSALTAEGADETLEALSLGAVDFIAKPSGPISLEIDRIAEALVEKVRMAAGARIPRSRRLTERVRARISRVADQPRARSAGKKQRLAGDPLTGVAAVLVGVSTGGPPALDALLQPLPADFPWPIVIAQHMPASFTGALARRLDRQCALSVREVSAATSLEPGTAYIGRGDADLIMSRRFGDVVALSAPARADLPWHPSADRLVDSACEVIGAEALVGVLMTGMGTDGARAMARMRQQGGHVIAQDAETAVVWGMPGALVAMDGADLVLPLESIAGQLCDWART
ncbi:two-component system chemotaxis response regulator CheB [Novosphingobium sp. PhB165]|uniref:chemotaxis-specific protein-glutamate methyltransferase CheB n=1 Tax=Novosphingobium sp. PhB165 TaxID=2485105 RepID=UPI0010F0FA34|nr:chemotaxis-specific protein-glutamate methyltransferase CheB [Novosphingobium sp. PhB165]TCM20634.1 two-component system chemotaxis response regulator CheB [Novosphingobium sp. PhB165]